jgi:quercetin dioxygenase-like cupin family protein
MMIHKKSGEVESQQVGKAGAKDTSMRLLIGEADGALDFQMRMFEVKPGGHSPFHSHPWEHETFIVSGAGSVKTDQGDIKIEAGDVVFVQPDDQHSFQADAGETLVFICCVPSGAA